jgi:hypothetical protein
MINLLVMGYGRITLLLTMLCCTVSLWGHAQQPATTRDLPQTGIKLQPQQLPEPVGAAGFLRSSKVLLQPVPQNFYTTNLGFFCRQELHMEQRHVPVTFRLGSMDYCNRLEQKPGYR